jgi:predicted component of type VI protein secretion system
MAYIVVYHTDQELARHELQKSITIGRSPECDLSVHDILLSRRHCKIETDGDRWVVNDLGSKNGTRVGGNPACGVQLSDGDVIRMGKTAIRFRAGAFVGSSRSKPQGIIRPADPFEALAGTVRDFTFQYAAISPNGIPMPNPRPVPKEPAAYSSDDVRTMVSELVSSSWDSIYENARRPDPVMPGAMMAQSVRRRRAREPRVDIALQAHPEPGDEPLPLPPIRAIQNQPASARKAIAQTSMARRTVSNGNIRFLVRTLVPILQWFAIAMLLWPN